MEVIQIIHIQLSVFNHILFIVIWEHFDFVIWNVCIHWMLYHTQNRFLENNGLILTFNQTCNLICLHWYQLAIAVRIYWIATKWALLSVMIILNLLVPIVRLNVVLKLLFIKTWLPRVLLLQSRQNKCLSLLMLQLSLQFQIVLSLSCRTHRRALIYMIHTRVPFSLVSQLPCFLHRAQ